MNKFRYIYLLTLYSVSLFIIYTLKLNPEPKSHEPALIKAKVVADHLVLYCCQYNLAPPPAHSQSTDLSDVKFIKSDSFKEPYTAL